MIARVRSRGQQGIRWAIVVVLAELACGCSPQGAHEVHLSYELEPPHAQLARLNRVEVGPFLAEDRTETRWAQYVQRALAEAMSDLADDPEGFDLRITGRVQREQAGADQAVAVVTFHVTDAILGKTMVSERFRREGPAGDPSADAGHPVAQCVRAFMAGIRPRPVSATVELPRRDGPLGRAHQLLAEGDYGRAADAARNLLTSDATNHQAMFALGLAYEGLGLWPAAEAQYRHAARLADDPRYRAALDRVAVSPAGR